MDICNDEPLILKYGTPSNCNSFLLDTNVLINIGDKLIVYINNSSTPEICTVTCKFDMYYSIDKIFDSIYIERKFTYINHDYTCYIPLLLKSNVTHDLIIEKQQKQIQYLMDQIQFLINYR